MTAEQFVSYAQHGEDVILWRALGGRADVTYVDVGAFHPTDDSVTRALYERGWRGVNIEPQPDRLAAFEQERPEDVNLSMAIGDRDGTIALTVPAIEGWATTLEPRTTGAEQDAVSLEVPLRTLETLLPELGVERLDVLKVDVEGAEPAVVRGLLAGPLRPLVCVIEGEAPGLGRVAGEEAVRLLVEAGYRHCMFDGLNHYLTTDDALVAALSVPAGPLDEFVRASVHNLLEERSRLHATIAALAMDNVALREQVGTLVDEASALRDDATSLRSQVIALTSSDAVRPDGGTTATPVAGTSAAAPGTGGSAKAPAREVDEPVEPSAEGTVAEPDGIGDLPIPTPAEITGSEASLSVPTADVPPGNAGLHGLPARPPSLLPPSERQARRRATFVRLLGGLVPAVTEITVANGPADLDPAAIEAMAAPEAVATLYEVILGRAADAEGLAAWVGEVDAGVPLITLARRLFATDEARLQSADRRQRLATDLTSWANRDALREIGVSGWDGDRLYRPGSAAHEMFVEALYEVAFQRRPSRDELRYEVDKLVAGTGREFLIRAYAAQPQAKTRILGRSAGGLRGRVRELRNRRTYVDTFRGLVVAAESRQIARLLATLPSSRSASTPDEES